jgi:hypothetical protein
MAREYHVGEKVLIIKEGKTAVVSSVYGSQLVVVMDDTHEVRQVLPCEIEPYVAETVLHDANGKFAKGHKKVPGSGVKKGYKQIQNVIIEQLYPYLTDLGSIIAMIEDPYDQIRAIALMARHAIPTQAAVSVTDQTPRNLTAEQELAKLNATFEGLPEPEIKDEAE